MRVYVKTGVPYDGLRSVDFAVGQMMQDGVLAVAPEPMPAVLFNRLQGTRWGMGGASTKGLFAKPGPANNPTRPGSSNAWSFSPCRALAG